MTKLIKNIPTHLFLGFLGVGKTSAILSCFKQKPNNEHWVVVVNEFGKQGIDGKIYKDKGIAVKEVPGGCLCCVAGVPFQIAIVHILKQQKPDRLFIESSGASHAEGVIKTLSHNSFKEALTLKAKVCLIDPNHLLDKRYFNNVNYQAQLNAADVLIVNKMDQARPEALPHLDRLIDSFNPAKSLIQKTSYGDVDSQCLHAAIIDAPQQAKKYFSAAANPIAFKTFGWDFGCDDCFNRSQLAQWMQQAQFIRAKGIVNTEQGWHSFNAVNGETHSEMLKPQQQARIEVILDENHHFSSQEVRIQLSRYIINR